MTNSAPNIFFRNLVTISTMIAAASCANAPVMPTQMVPSLPAPKIVDVLTPAQPLLDCAARPFVLNETESPVRIMLGDLPNEVGNSLGEMRLPSNLRSTVRSSFSRFDNGIEIYGGSGLNGINPATAFFNGQILNLQPHSVLPSQIADVDLVIEGGIVEASVVREANANAEIEILGGGAKAELYAIRVQLYFLSPKSQREVLRALTLGVRVIVAENGIAGFYVHDKAFGRYRLAIADRSPATAATQFLSDTIIGLLMIELASEKFGTPRTDCEQFLPFNDLGRPIGVEIPETHQHMNLPVHFEEDSQRICTTINGTTASRLPPGFLKIRWRQFRRSGIPIPPLHSRTFRSDRIQAAGGMKVCLPSVHVTPFTHRTEVTVESLNGGVIGAGRFTDYETGEY